MPEPALDSVAQDLKDALLPFVSRDDENEYAGHHLLAAIGAMWQPVDDLIRDTEQGPGWSVLVDVDRAPGWALPWLGQLAGVRVTAGASEASQRQEVRRADGQSRGTVATIIDTIVPYLDLPKRAELLERFNAEDPGVDSAYHVTARVRFADLPAGLEDEAIASITARFFAALPAGIIGHIVFTDSRTYATVRAEFSTYADVMAENSSYFHLRSLEP